MKRRFRRHPRRAAPELSAIFYSVTASDVLLHLIPTASDSTPYKRSLGLLLRRLRGLPRPSGEVAESRLNKEQATSLITWSTERSIRYIVNDLLRDRLNTTPSSLIHALNGQYFAPCPSFSRRLLRPPLSYPLREAEYHLKQARFSSYTLLNRRFGKPVILLRPSRTSDHYWLWHQYHWTQVQ